MSRAYYACYHSTRRIACSNCVAAGRGRSGEIGHATLLRILKHNTNTDKVKGLGEELSTLYGGRERADYYMEEHIHCGDADVAIEQADLFLRALQSTPPRDIGMAVDAYFSQFPGGGPRRQQQQ